MTEPLKKLGTTLRFSEEMRNEALAWASILNAPPETPQDRAERLARQKAERDAKAATANAFLANLFLVADTATKAVLVLHERTPEGACLGDDVGGYDWEHAEWPCRTVETIATAHGIEVPT